MAKPRTLASALAKVRVVRTTPGEGVRIASELVERLVMQLQLNEAECAAAGNDLEAGIANLRRQVLQERLRMARAVLFRATAATDDWLCRPGPGLRSPGRNGSGQAA